MNRCLDLSWARPERALPAPASPSMSRMGGVACCGAVFAASRRGRVCRSLAGVLLASLPLSPDLGVSLFEFEPLAESEAPRVTGFARGVDASSVWSGGAPPPPPRTLSAHEVTVTLPRPLPTSGLEVYWGAPWRRA